MNAQVSRRRGRGGEQGFTLVEVIVTMAILSVVIAAIAAAYTVGFKVLAQGGAGDRLAGAHDQMVFEQQLSQDVSRAGCVSKPGSPALGDCSQGNNGHGFQNAAIQAKCSATGTVLCIGWPDIPAPPGQASCHVAVYSQVVGAPTVKDYHRASRLEYAIDPSGNLIPQGSYHLTTDPVLLTDPGANNAPGIGVSTIKLATVTASLPDSDQGGVGTLLAAGSLVPTAGDQVTLSGGSGPSQTLTVASVSALTVTFTGSIGSDRFTVASWQPTWVSAIRVKITAVTGGPNAPTGILFAGPVATDPAGTAAVTTPGGSPC